MNSIKAKSTDMKPLEVTGVNAVNFGIGLWSIALIVLIIFSEKLEAAGKFHWIWIASSGLILGFLGKRYTVNRVKRLGLQSEPSFLNKFKKK